MATKRPAKLAIGKKRQDVRMDPVSGKVMTAVKVFSKSGASGMQWVVIEEFDGSEAAAARMISIR